MEDTTSEDKLVHVLRPSFRPSQPLAEGIENLVKPGRKLPRLLLYGTKEIAVDLVKYNNFDYIEKINEARQKLRSEGEPIYIDSRVHFRAIGSKAVRAAFIPTLKSQLTFNNALEAMDTLPNLFPPYSRLPHFFLYIDIPFTHVASPDQWHEHSDSLKDALAGAARSLYYVLPESITGNDDTLTFLKKPQPAENEENPEDDNSTLVLPL